MREGARLSGSGAAHNTTSAYPMGVYHPHPELHHIKKENIGLIEVKGAGGMPPA